jgi:hypothetical protein
MFDSPLEILERWIDYVNNRDAEGLICLYHESAVLMPTFSDRILDRPEKIRDYFMRLAAREKLRISLHKKTVHEQAISGTWVVISGLYRWKMTVEGERISYEARFSFLLDPRQDKPIIHHHSSQIPRMI